MTLKNAEELAQYVYDVAGLVPVKNAGQDLVRLAEAVLAMLPTARAAIEFYEKSGEVPDPDPNHCPRCKVYHAAKNLLEVLQG